MDEEHPVSRCAQERVEGGWLLLAYPDNPTIRLDGRLLDRVLVDDPYLVLSVADVTAFLRISAGSEVARSIAEELAAHTRSAPIADRETYEIAKRRLTAACEEKLPLVPALFVGDDLVRVSADVLYVGQFACRVSDVEWYATISGELPLPNGRLQAALAMLVIAAQCRQDDQLLLRRRIADYETQEFADPPVPRGRIDR